MTSTSPPSVADGTTRLRALLRDLDLPPVALLEQLRAQREALMGDTELGSDLDRHELAYLTRKSTDARLRVPLGAPTERAERAAMLSRLRSLEAAARGDAASLFDLVEIAAQLEHVGLPAEAARARAAVDVHIAAIDAADDRLRYEAGERYAALATEEEDLELTHRLLLIDGMRRACVALRERTGDPLFAKLARRLARASCDRTLQLRLERLLTRRGAVLMETISFAALIAVFVLLAVEVRIGEREWLLLLDALICTYFIVEFLFKLALAPARRSWFLRNVVTDLLPAIPAAMYFAVHIPAEADFTILGRLMRFLRVVTIARYFRALRPILGVVRLVLFLVRGLDALVQRFSPLLNRNFVFFERHVLPLESDGEPDVRTLCFRALRREHVVLDELPVASAAPLLAERAERLAGRFGDSRAAVAERAQRLGEPGDRDIPVEYAIEYLWRLQPAEIGQFLPRKDVLAIDRVARIINAPIVRSLPLVRQLRSPERADTPEERVVDLGRRVALLLERARERALHVADMHGIVTGPQVLDRVASALVKASKRPAVRLLMFGGLFTIVRALVGAESWLGGLLTKFVATPLVILGSVCLVLFGIGRWLKSLAGEAADTFKLVSEAHFIGLLELVKRRRQDGDLQFLSRRVFRLELDDWEGAGAIGKQIRASRTGVLDLVKLHDDTLQAEVYRVALLYLHFLDGAPLHENDVKTTEQLLANLSLENIRNSHLGWSRRERKRLRRLAPGEGGLLSGPHVWFRFITESVAVETAKRVTDYNLNCLTLEQRAVADPEERSAFAAWLWHRRHPLLGRLERMEEPGGTRIYNTTEFNALDFLSDDPQRALHIERVFGRAVLKLVLLDRERIIREIFGTRPLHELPRSQRTLNAYRFYQDRLSRGRLLFVPAYVLGALWSGVRLTVRRTVEVVREILAPEGGGSRQRERAGAVRGRAPQDPPHAGAGAAGGDADPRVVRSGVLRCTAALDRPHRVRPGAGDRARHGFPAAARARA
ncbi:MAG: ion transporter [Planctomycetes bacterium]|nr:ion transporter [Planctomycetota bacterium]